MEAQKLTPLTQNLGTLRSRKIGLEQVMVGILLVALAIAVVWPLLRLTQGAFSSHSPNNPNAVYTFDTMKSIFTSPGSLTGMRNTIVLSTIVTVGSLFMGASLAWIISRTDVPMRRSLQFMVMAPLFMSPFAGAIAWMQLGSVKSGYLNVLFRMIFQTDATLVNIFTFGGMAWVMSLYFVPYAFILTISALSSMDASLEEASRVSGANILTTARRITAPIMLPAFAAAAIMIFVLSAEMFSIPGLFGGPAKVNTLPYQVYLSVGFFPARWQNAAATGFVLMVFMAFGIYLYRRMTSLASKFVTVSGKGTRHESIRLGFWRWVALGVVLSYFTLAVVLPYAAIILGSFVPYSSPDIYKEIMKFTDSTFFTTRFWTNTLTSQTFKVAIWNTLKLGVLAPTLACAIALFVSYIVIKTKYRVRGTIDFLASLPIAIPGIVFGVALVWTYIGTSIYLTTTILLLAYVTRYIPNALRLMNANLMQLSNELQEAARMSGASAMRSAWDIIFPLVRPAIMASWVLLFINVVRELSATIMLYGPRSLTLPILLWDKMESGIIAEANVVALVVSGIILTAVVIASKVFKVNLGRGI